MGKRGKGLPRIMGAARVEPSGPDRDRAEPRSGNLPTLPRGARKAVT
jgi:hypothetical protein